jgi:Domain of unknown function (DUF4124)
MLRATIYTVCVGLALASAANADVYKYKDEKGNILYTDRPLHLPAERLSVQSQRTDLVALEERTADEATEAADREKARQDAAKAKAEQQKATAGKAEACNQARQDYLSRMNAQRVYEDMPNGTRRYLTEAELAVTRNSAKTAMDALCN